MKELFDTSWSLRREYYHTWGSIEKAFTKEETENIINLGESYGLKQGEVFNVSSLNQTKNLNSNFSNTYEQGRNNYISYLNSRDQNNFWIFQKLSKLGLEANEQFFNFDIHTLEVLQYSRYDVGMYQRRHIDTLNVVRNGIRKITFVVQLSDPSEYEGGELRLYEGGDMTVMNKLRGSIIFFPSFLDHEVSDVTKGSRKSLVGWILGTPFR